MSRTTKRGKRTSRATPVQKRYFPPPPAPSVLVGLACGACLWFPRAVAKRARTTIRIRTEEGVEIVVPTAGADFLTFAAGATRPWPIGLLEDEIDTIHLGINEKLWRTLEERRRDPRPVSLEEAERQSGLKPTRRKKS
jgi:hypothetical protein